MSSALRIGIAGLGTVGCGVVKILSGQQQSLTARCGRPLELVAVSARSRSKRRSIDLGDIPWVDAATDLAGRDDIDVVVELIGGSGGVALELTRRALAAGQHVVTANKALIAEQGASLARAAEARDVTLAYEAAVAGGIPIVMGLRDGLAADTIDAVHGILNGTCNYILTQMRAEGRDFADVLAEAQSLGYAEAEPSTDVDGFDAAHKIAILAGLAFNGSVDFSDVHIEGIRDVAPIDIEHAEELGYRVKLLGITERSQGRISVRVHPALVPKSLPIAAVEGVFNAVIAQGDPVDQVMMVGRGAGEGPTASAVVGDLAAIARGARVPCLGVPAARLQRLDVAPIGRRHGAYYLRATVIDRPGVIADIAAHLRDHDVSVESFLQRGRAPGEPVDVVILTHETVESAMRAVLVEVEKLTAVVAPPILIRIETPGIR